MFDLDAYITNLIKKYPSVNSIWLIGSRANNTYKDDSDWDLVIFADQNILDSLSRTSHSNVPEVDLLVVYNSNDFISPWSRDNKENKHKKGCLKTWKWHFINEFEAKYTVAIGLRNAIRTGAILYTPQEEELRAKRLWPKQAVGDT